MPSNPQKTVLVMYNYVEGILHNLTNDGVDYEGLVLQCITQFPVSAYSVDYFVKRFFVNRGLVLLEHGVLYPGSMSKKRVAAKEEADTILSEVLS